MIAQTLSLARSLNLYLDTLLPAFLFSPQWHKEVLIKNLLPDFPQNIVRGQIVLWLGLNYNLFNPPVWGGSQPSVRKHREPACPITEQTSKGALAMLQSVSFFQGFLPTALSWEKFFCLFFSMRAHRSCASLRAHHLAGVDHTHS